MEHVEYQKYNKIRYYIFWSRGKVGELKRDSSQPLDGFSSEKEAEDFISNISLPQKAVGYIVFSILKCYGN